MSKHLRGDIIPPPPESTVSSVNLFPQDIWIIASPLGKQRSIEDHVLHRVGLLRGSADLFCQVRSVGGKVDVIVTAFLVHANAQIELPPDLIKHLAEGKVGLTMSFGMFGKTGPTLSL